MKQGKKITRFGHSQLTISQIKRKQALQGERVEEDVEKIYSDWVCLIILQINTTKKKKKKKLVGDLVHAVAFFIFT